MMRSDRLIRRWIFRGGGDRCSFNKATAMRILVMGGTRFIGVYLTQQLVREGHEVVLFNRGKKPSPVLGLKVIKGDRTVAADLNQLAGESFDAIFDNNGRELSDTQPLAELI